MQDNPQKFNNSWIGYDLPYDVIENNPVVLQLRKKGYEKRIKAMEHHVTCAHYGEVDLAELEALVASCEKRTGSDLSSATINVNGIGFISHEKGNYAYFSINEKDNNPAILLKNSLRETGLYDETGNCDNLHISIGGPDPFSKEKPKQKDLSEPFEIVGKLVFVGNDGERYKKLFWNGKLGKFEPLVSERPAEKPPRNISNVMMPNKPHLDPITAYYLLLRYGNEKFPGISEAKLFFWDSGTDPDAETLKKWNEEGSLLIDIAGGEFDHHLVEGGFSSLLVAKYLGIEENPEMKAILEYLREDDNHGLHNKFGDLAHIVKMMHKQNVDIQKIFDLVFLALNSMIYFDDEAKKEFEERSVIHKVKRGKNKMKVAVIESASQNVAKYAMQNERVGVVIQKRPTGHIMIFTNNIYKIDLRDVIGAIRKKELELLGKEVPDLRILKKEGKHPDVQHWYYHRSLNAILNGSDALSDTPATKLNIDEIIEIVLFSVSTDYFDRCDNCEESKCPHYRHGFYKCYAKRNNLA